jgi:thiol-disulfide isomerase/thioredoxin
MEKSRQTGKPVMIDFWANWCGWCHRLDETTYVDPVVVKLAEHFIPLKLNTEGGPREEAIARRYGVTSLPTIGFVSPAGNPLLRVTGFYGPGQFPRAMEAAREVAARVIGLEAALERESKDPIALAALGAHLFEQESYDMSRQHLQKAIKYDGTRPADERKKTRMLLGVIQQGDNRLPEAEVLLKEALMIKPPGEHDPRILYVLGKTYLSWGRQGESRKMLQRILAEYPTSTVAPKARQILTQLEKP